MAGADTALGIDTTSKRMQDPAEKMAFLGEAMLTGSSAPIERQERDGQHQLVNSDRLPSDIHGDRAEWEALGFTFGEPDPNDPLFMPATLPLGWERQATDHAMGSVIVDTLGRKRVSIFYKAAFYDRRAHMSLIGLGWYVTKHIEYDGPLVFDDEWATRETVAAAMAAQRDHYLTEAAEFRGYAADEKNRDHKNRAGCAEIAEKREAVAAKYEAALAKLSGTDA
jgi:hypothetical protein